MRSSETVKNAMGTIFPPALLQLIAHTFLTPFGDIHWAQVRAAVQGGMVEEDQYGPSLDQSVDARHPSVAEQSPAGRKACPHCAEYIMADSIKCRYCGSDVSS